MQYTTCGPQPLIHHNTFSFRILVVSLLLCIFALYIAYTTANIQAKHTYNQTSTFINQNVYSFWVWALHLRIAYSLVCLISYANIQSSIYTIGGPHPLVLALHVSFESLSAHRKEFGLDHRHTKLHRYAFCNLYLVYASAIGGNLDRAADAHCLGDDTLYVCPLYLLQCILTLHICLVYSNIQTHIHATFYIQAQNIPGICDIQTLLHTWKCI